MTFSLYMSLSKTSQKEIQREIPGSGLTLVDLVARDEIMMSANHVVCKLRCARAEGLILTTVKLDQGLMV